MHLITIFQVKKEMGMDLTFLEMGMDLTILEMGMDLTILKMEYLLLVSTDHHNLHHHHHHRLRRHNLHHHHHSLRRHKLRIHLQRVCHQLHQAMKQLGQHRFQLCQSLSYKLPQHLITRLRLTKSHQQHLFRQRLHILLSVPRPLNL